jgi:hypothetical protein
MDIEDEVQAKGIETMFYKILAEHLSNLKKDRVIQIQKVFKTPNRQDQREKKNPRHVIDKNTKYTEQRKNIESCKRSDKSHIKVNP